MVRGKILRDTNSGPGVLVVDGVQKTFTLEDHWKSDTPSKVGGVVDVELNEAGDVISVHAVDEAALAKEQAQKALELAGTHGKKLASLASTHGKSAGGALVAKVGIPTLIALVALAICWLFLSALNIQLSRDHQVSLTFYEILKLMNGSSMDLASASYLKHRSAGFNGFLLWVALLAPIAAHLIQNKWTQLTYCAPLAFMAYVWLSVSMGIRGSFDQMNDAAGAFGGERAAQMAQKMAEEMLEMMLNAISVGFGAYIAIAIAVYLAVIGVKKFLVASA